MAKRRFLLLRLCSESGWTPSAVLIEEFLKNYGGVSRDRLWKWINKLERDEFLEIQKKGDHSEIKLSIRGHFHKSRRTESSSSRS